MSDGSRLLLTVQVKVPTKSMLLLAFRTFVYVAVTASMSVLVILYSVVIGTPFLVHSTLSTGPPLDIQVNDRLTLLNCIPLEIAGAPVKA